MQDTIILLINLFLLTFVLTSMFGTGLSLTVPQILEPLKSVKLVLLSLLVNFVIAPVLAFVIAFALNLNEGLRIGLIIIAVCAGAPFLPKLATIAKGNLALSAGLMVLLMVTTVVYAPIVLPLLIPGVAVNPWAIAQPLITLMLIPLGIGLFVRAWRPDAASSLVPTLSQISNISLMLMAVLGLLIGYRELLAAIGTGAFMAAVSLIGGALIFGYLFASGDSTNRSVMGMGAGQRNISAALLVATSNFSDPNVIVMVLVASVVGLIILFLTAGFLGKRSVEPIVSPS